MAQKERINFKLNAENIENLRIKGILHIDMSASEHFQEYRYVRV